MRNAHWRISEAGAASLGLQARPQAVHELVSFWVGAFQPAIGRMLLALVDAGGEWLSRAELCARSGVSPTSSTLGAGIKELRDHGLVDEQSGELRAAAVLLGPA